MMNRDKLVLLDATTAMLLRLADELREAGDLDGALAASDAAEAAMVLLDLDTLRARVGA
ncbi:hypothetical protein [Methylobacterium sp. 1030]|uniref:hypothetical protein n=1 Tax=Methylobacterium sp. 1030 TaxID=3156404 RepID=UPI003396F465